MPHINDCRGVTQPCCLVMDTEGTYYGSHVVPAPIWISISLFFTNLHFTFQLVKKTNPCTNIICFPALPRPLPQTARAHDKRWPKMINNMKSSSSTWIFSSHFSSLNLLNHLLLFFFLSLRSLLCSVLCWQALSSQNALHGEPHWRQPVRLQTSTEEDLPETKAHQTVHMKELFLKPFGTLSECGNIDICIFYSSKHLQKPLKMEKTAFI